MSAIPGTVILDVRVKDQSGAPVAGVQVNIPTAVGARTISTRQDGVAVGFTVPFEETISVVATFSPAGYTHSSTPKNFFINRSGEVPLTVTKTAPPADEDFVFGGGQPDPSAGYSGTWAQTGEVAQITNVEYPPYAKKGDEIKVVVTAKNVGDETCELRAVLRNYENKKIDTNPEERLKLYAVVKPGASKTFEMSTKEYFFGRWSMPDYDWNLKIEIAEIDKNWGSVQKVHHSKKFTIKLADPTVPGSPGYVAPVEEGEWVDTTPVTPEAEGAPGAATLMMDAPSIVIAGDVVITGRAPSADTRVEIRGVKKFIGFDFLRADSLLAIAQSGSDGQYSTTIELDDFGAVEVYALIKKHWKPTGALSWFVKPVFWLDPASEYQPLDWLAKDSRSGKKTILVLTYPILLALIAMVAMVAEKKYNFVGMFKKKRGKK